MMGSVNDSEPRTLLLVDDDPGMLDTLEDIFQLHGYRVLSASSAQAALSILARTSVDVILSDIRMPGLSGLDLLHRARRERPEPPVLLMTAYSDPHLLREAAELGSPVLSKPLDIAELLSLVEQELPPSRPAL